MTEMVPHLSEHRDMIEVMNRTMTHKSNATHGNENTTKLIQWSELTQMRI